VSLRLTERQTDLVAQAIKLYQAYLAQNGQFASAWRKGPPDPTRRQKELVEGLERAKERLLLKS
jgi:hypothetical protein